MHRSLAFGFVALAFLTQAAAAQTVSLQSITVSDSAQAAFTSTYGETEAETLKQDLRERLVKAFADQGITLTDATAPVVLNVTVQRVKPNRPTWRQMRDTLGLDFARSFGVGGAEITGVLSSTDGSTSVPIKRTWFDSDIDQSATKSTWHDARRVFRQFATQAAFVAQTTFGVTR